MESKLKILPDGKNTQKFVLTDMDHYSETYDSVKDVCSLLGKTASYIYSAVKNGKSVRGITITRK